MASARLPELPAAPVGGSASTRAGYVRAAGRAPLALYDPFVALTMRERLFRARLLEQVLEGGGASPLTVVDVGCGTGSFALALAGAGATATGARAAATGATATASGATATATGATATGATATASAAAGSPRVIGIDGDPEALDRARAKPGADFVQWREGRADRLPLAEASADRLVLSLLLHHLAPADQHAALAEARRVLAPGGRVHVAEWGPPRDPAMRVAFRALQLLDGVENTAPLGRGELPAMLATAGFAQARLHDRLRTTWGVLELRSATRI